jgi:hypothetical protein
MPVPQLQQFNLLGSIMGAEQVKNAKSRGKALNLLNTINQDKVDHLAEDRATAKASATAEAQRKQESHDIDMEKKKWDFFKVRVAEAKDHLPAVTRDTYDDYLLWVEKTMKIPVDTFKDVTEVWKMTDAEFETYKQELGMKAEDITKMGFEAFKTEQQKAMEKEKSDLRKDEETQKQQGRVELEDKKQLTKKQSDEKDNLRKRWEKVQDHINKVNAGVDIPIPSESRDKALADWKAEAEAIEKKYKEKYGEELGAGGGGGGAPKMKYNPKTGKLEPV